MLDSLDSKLFIFLKVMVYHAYQMHVFPSHTEVDLTRVLRDGGLESIFYENIISVKTLLSLSLSLSLSPVNRIKLTNNQLNLSLS